MAASLCGPANCLGVLSENIGAVSVHNDHIWENVVQYVPHVYILQEARMPAGDLRGWNLCSRTLGYFAHLDSDHNLLRIWLRGLFR